MLLVRRAGFGAVLANEFLNLLLYVLGNVIRANEQALAAFNESPAQANGFI
jgi:hypothetical protein